MQIISKSLFFAPSDLITYMESAFASHLERRRLVDPGIKDLMDPEDLMLKTLQKKGYEHEDAFLKSLKAEGRDLVEIENASTDIMLSQTRDAMSGGAEIIAQAYLKLYNFGGMADVLIRLAIRFSFFRLTQSPVECAQNKICAATSQTFQYRPFLYHRTRTGSVARSAIDQKLVQLETQRSAVLK